MPTPTKISYLRKGRKLRCTGTVIDTDAHTGIIKVKPLRDNWRMVLVTAAEIDAGREKAHDAMSEMLPIHTNKQ